jgi:hypothetical protein
MAYNTIADVFDPVGLAMKAAQIKAAQQQEQQAQMQNQLMQQKVAEQQQRQQFGANPQMMTTMPSTQAAPDTQALNKQLQNVATMAQKAITFGNGQALNRINASVQSNPQLKQHMQNSGLGNIEIGQDPKTKDWYQIQTKNWTRKELDTLSEKYPGAKVLASLPEGEYSINFDPVNKTVRSFTNKSNEGQDDLSLSQMSPDFRVAQKALNEQLGRKPTYTELIEYVGKMKGDIAAEAGRGRAEAYGDVRQNQVIDTNDNSLKYVSSTELNKLNKEQPGRFVPLAGGTKAMTKMALIQDIADANQTTREAINNLKTDFTPALRSKLAFIFKSRNPGSAFDNFMGSTWANTLTPDQQDFVIAINQNIENAMAMRSVLGAGQGSEDLREAIKRTIPGMLSPNKAYALKQIEAFNNQLNRLARGVPKVKLRSMEEVRQTMGNNGKDKPKFVIEAVE